MSRSSPLKWIFFASLIILALHSRIFFGQAMTYGDLGAYFTDIVLEYRNAIHTGSFFWTAGMVQGYPLLGNPQMGFAYPLNGLYLLQLNPIYIISIYIILHHIILATGSFLILRRFTADPAALLIAISASTTGACISVISMTTNFIVFAWIPWVAYSLHRCHQDAGTPKWNILLLWTSTYCMFAGGDPQFFVFVLPILILMPFSWTKRTRFLTSLVIFSAGISQVFLLSFLESVSLSARTKGINIAVSNSWNLDFALLLSLFQPSSVYCNLTGFAWEQLNGNISRQNWLESIYIGVIIPVLGLFAYRPRPWRIRSILAIIAICSSIAIATNFTSYIFNIEWTKIPILGMARYPVRFVLLAIPFLYWAAACGSKKALEGRISVFQAALGIISVSALIITLGIVHPFHSTGNQGTAIVWSFLMDMESGIQLLFLGLFFVAAIIIKGKFRNSWFYGILTMDVLLSFIIAWSQLGYTFPGPSDTSKFVTAEKLEGHRSLSLVYEEYLQESKLIERTGLKSDKITDTAKYNSLPYFLSSDPYLLIESRMKMANSEVINFQFELFPKIPWKYIVDVVANDSGTAFENLIWHLGTTDVVTLVKKNGNPARIGPRLTYLSYIKAGGMPAVRLGTPGFMPMFFLFDTTDPSRLYQKMRETNNIERSVAFTDSIQCPNGSKGSKPIQWEKINDQHWVAHVSNARGLLGFRQTSYPGWRAFVDGIQRPTIRTNLVNQGVCLDGHNESVEFVFRPRFFWHQVCLTAFGFLILLGCIAYADPNSKFPTVPFAKNQDPK